MQITLSLNYPLSRTFLRCLIFFLQQKFISAERSAADPIPPGTGGCASQAFYLTATSDGCKQVNVHIWYILHWHKFFGIDHFKQLSRSKKDWTMETELSWKVLSTAENFPGHNKLTWSVSIFFCSSFMLRIDNFLECCSTKNLCEIKSV